MNSISDSRFSSIRGNVTGAFERILNWRCLVLFALLLLSAACNEEATLTNTPSAIQAPTSLEELSPKTPAFSVNSAQLGEPEFTQQEQTRSQPAERLTGTSVPVTTLLSSPSGTPLPHPEQTSDLLFIAGGDLMRWDYVTGFSGSLVTNVAEFSASANGKRVAVLRTKQVAANGIELFDLSLLDFDTMQVSTLLEETPRLDHLAISPDGAYISYTIDQKSGLIYALPTDDPSRPIELGKCHFDKGTACQDFSWSPDSEQFLWSDAQGVWVSTPGWTAPNLVHSGKLEVSDPQGKISVIDVQLLALKWSPVGRYVLATVTPTASGVNWHAILDTLTGRLVEVPDSFETQVASANASWSPSGDLLTAQVTSSLETDSPAIDVWHVLATHDGLLIQSQTIVLYLENFTFAVRQNETDAAPCLNWLAAHEMDTLMLGATRSEANNFSTLFQLNLVDGTLDELIDVPFQASDVLWAPDGAGALIIDTAGKVYFAHSSSGNLYNLSPVFGQDADHFIWLPPAPRS
jgi:hypothetical protein